MPRPKSKGGRPFALKPKQLERAIELACCGWTQKKIALFLKVSVDTVSRRLKDPGVPERIAEFKAKVGEDAERMMREWDDAQALAKRRRKPLTPEQIIKHIGEMAVVDAITSKPPAPQPAPEPPKPEVVYQPLYLVPPVQPRIEAPQTLYPRTFTAPDWRKTLPIPDLWTRKPVAAKPTLKTHGYGSPVRSNWPR